ncbi:MAG TPA: DNA alkylation repair protein [Galbitalea sp.]
MTDAAEFIDAALRYEVSPYSYPSDEWDGLERYGTSIGAVRGTIRDTLRRYPAMLHDEVTALCSELWLLPVVERRQAAIVLLQSRVESLVANDLTRIEGFVRSAGSPLLINQLTDDVLLPMFERMDARTRERVHPVLLRWASDDDSALAAVSRRITATL